MNMVALPKDPGSFENETLSTQDILMLTDKLLENPLFRLYLRKQLKNNKELALLLDNNTVQFVGTDQLRFYLAQLVTRIIVNESLRRLPTIEEVYGFLKFSTSTKNKIISDDEISFTGEVRKRGITRHKRHRYYQAEKLAISKYLHDRELEDKSNQES